MIRFIYLRRLSTLYFLGVLERELFAEPVSLKMSASLSDIMSELDRPTESSWHVLIGFLLAAVDLVFAVLEKSDLSLPELLSCFRVSKSLKRPPAIDTGDCSLFLPFADSSNRAAWLLLRERVADRGVKLRDATL